MRQFNILIVDDEELALLGLEAGVDWPALHIGKLFKAHSRDSAVELLQKERVDIIITDIEMPNGSGLELIRWVREHRPETRAVFYTGHAEFSYARDALRMGAEDYLLKPVPYGELTAILARIEAGIAAEDEQSGSFPDSQDAEHEKPTQIVERVKKLVQEHLSDESLQRDDLAAMVYISPGYLSRIFKKETGVALTDYIIRTRISVAKQLLSKTNLPITSISERVGISYSSYFTKLFKDQVGVTPQEYRHLHQ